MHIFSGSATPRVREEGQPAPYIEHHADVAELKPGDQPHTEVLIGPENNNKVVMAVRNIGETAARPVMETLAIDPPSAASFN